MKGFFKKVRQLFLRGLFSLIPIFITLYIIYFFLVFLYNFFDFAVVFLPEEFKKHLSLKILTASSTIIIFIFLSILAGIISKTLLGKTLQKMIEAFFLPIPIVNNIYKSLRQLFKLISNNDSMKFSKVVFVEYPYKGKWAIAFLTGKCSKRTSPDPAREFYTVFMPTTPNPTTGFLMIIEKNEFVYSDLSFDEAFKLILSGGIVKDSELIEEPPKNKI